MSKKYSHIEDIDDSNEDEEYNEMGIYLKENYELSDFLNYKKTCDILAVNSRWQYEKDMDELVEFFYKGEVDYNKSDNSSMFANEQNYKNLGIFQALLYTCLEPKYDLDIFYLTPILAKDMVESMEDRKLESHRLWRKDIQEQYSQSNNINKKFNWSTKTYK